jgi:hypothetical protein
LTATRAGIAVALSALLVQAPRLVLLLLAGARIEVSTGVTTTLLTVAGVGTALVVTGGNLYLSHRLVTSQRGRPLLAVLWLLVLAGTGGLLAPDIAAGVLGVSLPQLLSSVDDRAAWWWSIGATLLHELVAASCVLAAALASKEVGQLAELQLELASQQSQLELATARNRFLERHLQLRGQQPEQPAPVRQLRPANGKIVSCRNAGCTFQGSSKAEAGHQRACPHRAASGIAR